MSDAQIDERPKLQLSGKQVVASALAATSTSVASSTLGVTGTLVGAGVVSALSVTAGAVYNYSLDRTAHEVKRVTGASSLAVVRRRRAEERARVADSPLAQAGPAEPADLPTEPVTGRPSSDETVLLERDDVAALRREPPGATGRRGARRPAGLLAVGAVAVGIFGGVLGVLGTVEAAADRSVAQIVSGTEDSSTGRIFGGSGGPASGEDERDEAPGSTPTPSPSGEDDAATDDATPTPGAGEPGDGATSSPTATPSVEPSASPTPGSGEDDPGPGAPETVDPGTGDGGSGDDAAGGGSAGEDPQDGGAGAGDSAVAQGGVAGAS